MSDSMTLFDARDSTSPGERNGCLRMVTGNGDVSGGFPSVGKSELSDGSDGSDVCQDGSKKSRDRSSRPAMEIYRPPGLRSSTGSIASVGIQMPMGEYQQPPQAGTAGKSGGSKYGTNKVSHHQSARSVGPGVGGGSHHATLGNHEPSHNSINSHSSKSPSTTGLKAAAGSKQPSFPLPHRRANTSPLLDANGRCSDLPMESKTGIAQAHQGMGFSTNQQNFMKTKSRTFHSSNHGLAGEYQGNQYSNTNNSHPPLNQRYSHGYQMSDSSTTGISGNHQKSASKAMTTRTDNRSKSPGTSRPKSPGSGGYRSKSPGPAGNGGSRARSPGPHQVTTYQPLSTKFTVKQVADISGLLQTLQLSGHTVVQQYLESEFDSNDSARQLAQLLVCQSIEQGKPSKTVAKLCSLIMDGPNGPSFHTGLLTASQQYFDCRAGLRAEHFRFWLNFISFLPDLFAAIGFTFNGELVQVMLQCYNYMLKGPVLENLKIEELESLISCLLNVGYDLEREVPSDLAVFRTALRDAFISASEPWARKMLLLLVELSASGWKLPSEASEYYFQTSTQSSS